MKKKKEEINSLHNWRKPLSRCFMAALGMLILLSSSRWANAGLISDILFLSGIILAGIAAMGRLWCSVYISGYKINTLVTTGPYSMCRNPLYFFSLIGSVGVGLTSETIFIPAIILIVFLLYYPKVVNKEEKRLESVHQDNFERYRKKTAKFIPSFSSFNEPEDYNIKPRIFRKRLFDSVWFVWIIGVIKFIEVLHVHGLVPVYFELY